jgi:hypothetical protein
MAQTGFTPIQIYSTSTAAAVPLAGNLINSTLGSELAINITDGKLFYKDNANAVQVIGWKVVPATAGGTGQTSYTTGDLLFASSTTALSKLADVATGNALISGGVGVAPSYGKIGLTTHVSGVLPVANGGTNASTAGITAFNNITGYTASGATGTTSTNLVFSASPTFTGLAAFAQIRSVFNGSAGSPALDLRNSNGAQWEWYTPISDNTLHLDVWVPGQRDNVLTIQNVAGSHNITIDTGNLVIGTSGKGIDFSATPGTGTSELLADYEEGTWTPSVRGATTAGTYETVAAVGTYTKIGDTVHVQCRLALAAAITGGGSGYAQFTGLPFAYRFNTENTVNTLVQLNGVAFTGSYPVIERDSNGAATTMAVYGMDNAGGQALLNIAAIGVNDIIRFSLTYKV